MKSIPDVSKWQPRMDKAESLNDIFYKRCLQLEKNIVAKVADEKVFNIENFDSGITAEAFIREAFKNLLPDRYFVTKGIVNDRNGYTAGEQDIIIFNKLWFPILKTNTSSDSYREHFPIEGIYAIGEIKQTLTINVLDQALEKLVKGKRLSRPRTGESRISENRELHGKNGKCTNPLYSFLLAVNLDRTLSIDDVFIRFFEINKQLSRNEMINCLCILEKGTIIWCYMDEYKTDLQPERFTLSQTFERPIFPVLLDVNEIRKCALYDFFMHLSANLYDSILGAEDIIAAYGNSYNNLKMPPLPKFQIE